MRAKPNDEIRDAIARKECLGGWANEAGSGRENEEKIGGNEEGRRKG